MLHYYFGSDLNNTSLLYISIKTKILHQTIKYTMLERCENATKLYRIYVFTTFVCLSMALQISISITPFFLSFIGKDSSNAREIQTKLDVALHLPPKLITKYNGHNLVKLTHIAPALFWVLAIPIQFHRGIRIKYRTFHKYIGRIFLFTSFLMIFGVAVIFYRGLTYEKYLEDTKPITLPFLNIAVVETLQTAVSVRFLQSGALAIAYARKRKFDEHRIWIIRHCAMGLWVVLLRLVSLLASPFYLMLYGPVEAPGYIRGRIFFWSGVTGFILSYNIGEYAIRLLPGNGGDKKLK